MKLSESRAMLLCKPRTRLVETLRPLSVPSAGQVRSHGDADAEAEPAFVGDLLVNRISFAMGIKQSPW